jgi:HEAT repeat protein
LCEALKSKQRRTRQGAAEALAFMGARAGAEAAAASDALLVVLARDEDWEVRSLAATALGFLGRSGDTALAALRRALQDEHEIVRLNARDALKRLGHEAPANDRAPLPGKAAEAGQPRQV